VKKIFLLGDSIRLGYDSYVKESMANLAEVYYPAENCRFAAYMLREIHNWADQLHLEHVDAVHWNAGLWDTLRIYGDDPLTRPETYADTVERIIKRIRFLFPEAKIIFATSTPVLEEGFFHDFEGRLNRDVEEYNRIAAEVCRRNGCAVNDLYALLKDKPAALHSDQTHYYTPDATELIGGQVNRVLCEALDLDPALLLTPDKSRFAITNIPNDKDVYVKKGRLYTKIENIDTQVQVKNA